MYLTHFFSSNVITIVSHCCGFLEADRRNKLLHLTVLICHTEQLADSYYVNEIWRGGYFSSWDIRVIESNHIRAQGENRLLLWRAAHRLSELARLQVQRLGKCFLLSKGQHSTRIFFQSGKCHSLTTLQLPDELPPPLPLEAHPKGPRAQPYVLFSQGRKLFQYPRSINCTKKLEMCYEKSLTREILLFLSFGS